MGDTAVALAFSDYHAVNGPQSRRGDDLDR